MPFDRNFEYVSKIIFLFNSSEHGKFGSESSFYIYKNSFICFSSVFEYRDFRKVSEFLKVAAKNY